MHPKVSVIMPVYRNAKHVEQAVESILRQTYSDFELILIDDASDDETVSLLRSFTDPRIIRIEKEKNTGYTESLNMGLERARGEYIARMDGDDISLPARFEKQVALMDANPGVIVCGTWYRIAGTHKEVHPPSGHDAIRIAFLDGNALAHASVMIRKATLDQHKLRYNTGMEPAEDYDLWVRMSALGQLHNIPEVLLEYRVHDAQVSRLQKQKQDDKASLVRMQLWRNLLPASAPLPGALDPRFKKEWIQQVLESNRSQGIYPEALLERYLKKKFRTSLKEQLLAAVFSR